MPKASADSVVTCSLFCRQCEDGGYSIFDYHLYGSRVAVACVGANRAMAAYEETANWMVGYAMRFRRSPDLSRCHARVIDGPSGCGVAAGPVQSPFMFSMFGRQMYAVDPLLAQPQQPVPYCPRSSLSPPRHLPAPSPVVSVLQPPPPTGSRDSPPSPIPFLHASACS